MMRFNDFKGTKEEPKELAHADHLLKGQDYAFGGDGNDNIDGGIRTDRLLLKAANDTFWKRSA